MSVGSAILIRSAITKYKLGIHGLWRVFILKVHPCQCSMDLRLRNTRGGKECTLVPSSPLSLPLPLSLLPLPPPPLPPPPPPPPLVPPPLLCRLRLLLSQLERGDLPSVPDLKKIISYAADVLTSQSWDGGSTEKRCLRYAVCLTLNSDMQSLTCTNIHTCTQAKVPLPTIFDSLQL